MRASKSLLEKLQTLAKEVFHSYRQRCRKRGTEFALSEKEFLPLLGMDCHYCGSPPKNFMRKKRCGDLKFYYQGIDRIDNNKGYLLDNVVPCCYRCNQIKSDVLSYEEMLVVAEALTRLELRYQLQPNPQQLALEQLALLLSTRQEKLKDLG